MLPHQIAPKLIGSMEHLQSKNLVEVYYSIFTKENCNSTILVQQSAMLQQTGY